MAGLGRLLGPTLQELIREKRWDALRDYLASRDTWPPHVDAMADVAELLFALSWPPAVTASIVR